MLFLRFTARASVALGISNFKLDILHDSGLSHQKTENNVRFITRFCSTLF